MGPENPIRVYRVLLQLKGENCVFCEVKPSLKNLARRMPMHGLPAIKETNEAWVAVQRMIGGTERDAERAEELTRKVPEPLDIVFGSPGRGYAGFPKAGNCPGAAKKVCS